ncbi:protein of unknown function [Nitrospira japonica]|uniref:Uncharacterized protein n=1 Tax=Nitrospira japonica TaxID=1325564 RepID=A0A1W1IA32_9BACT|nr:protein of unknown function [Nitrospira japonica]
MITNPGEAYSKLGFSGTALELLHNVIRGQGRLLWRYRVRCFIRDQPPSRAFC